MNSRFFIGIDSGTQSTRVAIFDEFGKLVSLGASDNGEPIVENAGWFEHDPELIWKAVVKASKQALDGFEGNLEDIVSIGVSSQRATMCTLDSEGNPIIPHISWMDSRLAFGVNVEGVPAELVPLAYYSKANWLSINKPDVFEKAAKFTTITGWLTHIITGEFKDSVANQLGAWPLNFETEQWFEDDTVAKMLGMRNDQLCELVKPTEVLGYVSAKIAEEVGFPVGIPVIATGGDKQCEVLGAGVINAGEAYLTFGTLAGVNVVGDEFKSNSAFHTIVSCVPGKLNFEATVLSGFWTVSWFRDQLSKDLKSEALKQECSVEEILNREAKDIPAGSGGLIIVPDWIAPLSKPNSKGIMIGFDKRHTRSHIFKAIIEGIIFSTKENLEIIQKEVGFEISEVVVGGGGSRSDIAMQAAADILGIPAVRAKQSETSSLGACIAAAVGVGVYNSIEEATKKMCNNSERFMPIPENQEVYSKLYQNAFKKLYPLLSDVLKEVSDATN